VDGVVEEIYVAEAGGAPMTRVEAVEAIERKGLRGDRYMEGKGYWSGVDECEVTLIEIESIEAIEREAGIGVAHGEHRRNVVTRGVRLADLAGRRFRVGGAELEYDRPRPPCRYIESITEPGMMAALGGGRGGICARVVRSGHIREGDAIEILSEEG
jgi:MOSC domain-containing protein YiiM